MVQITDLVVVHRMTDAIDMDYQDRGADRPSMNMATYSHLQLRSERRSTCEVNLLIRGYETSTLTAIWQPRGVVESGLAGLVEVAFR